jgi:ribulose-phosphate 3-epimerase
MGWNTWLRGPSEVAPSLYAADFTRLGEQIGTLLDAGCRIFHFDVGDGHFIPPVTIGPVVLRAIAPLIHDAGGVIDCHLMVADPAHHVPEFAQSGADSVTFHVEATSDPRGVGVAARAFGLAVGLAFNPGTDVVDAVAAARAAEADLVLCMSIVPGYSGQPFLPESYGRIEELATLVQTPIQVDGGIGEDNVAAVRAAGASVFVAGNAVFADPDPPAAYRRIVSAAR